MAEDDYIDQRIAPTDERLQEWKGTIYGGNPLPVMVGPCGHCGHRCEIPLTNRVIRGAAPAGAGDTPRAPEPVARLFRCNCIEAHDRPDGVLAGCGRWWIGRVVNANDNWVLSLESDASLTVPAIELARRQATAEASVRAAAEKWIAGVSALLGLYSFAAVITAKNALVGLSTTSKVLIAAGLLFSTGAATASLVMSYTAAYGWPGTDDVGTSERMRRWHLRLLNAPERRVEILRWAVLLAMSATALLLITTLALWFLPRSPASVAP